MTSARIEELDWAESPMGPISLRRRRDPLGGEEIYEVKLGDDYLMSSLFVAAEVEVASLALGQLSGNGLGVTELDVVVGGLGLGYTAQAVLASPAVRSLVVVETLAPVISWTERGLIPTGRALTSDPRCRVVGADFFELARWGQLGTHVGGAVHAVIVDIDHSPRHVLHPSHADFYTAGGVRRLADQLHPGGVFSLWSNDPPDDRYVETLSEAFAEVRAAVIRFPNPLQDNEATNTVYVASGPVRG